MWQRQVYLGEVKGSGRQVLLQGKNTISWWSLRLVVPWYDVVATGFGPPAQSVVVEGALEVVHHPEVVVLCPT